MSGAGSMMELNRKLAQNRNAKRSKRKGFKDTYDGQTLTKQKLRSKKIPLDELQMVKEKIRRQIKKDRRLRSFIFLLIIVSITTWFIYI